jgi:hypothetical protein
MGEFFQTDLLDIVIQQLSAKTKIDKKEKTILYYKYLIDHLQIFDTQEENFIFDVLDKANEYKYITPDFKDLIEVIEKFLNLYQFLNAERFYKFFNMLNDMNDIQKLKEFKNMDSPSNINQNLTLYDYMSNPYNVVVKYENEFRGYTRSCLIEYLEKNLGFPTKEKISIQDIKYFEDKTLRFFELLKIDEEKYVLLPYETKTFIEKFKLR